MSVAAFDTLKYAKQLKQAGIPDEHAEAQAAALAEALQAGLQELATKNDIEQLRLATKNDAESLRQEINLQTKSTANEFAMVRQEIKNLDARIDGQLLLLKWMFGATFAGVIAILVRLFFFRVV